MAPEAFLTILALLAIGAYVVYAMKPEERMRLWQKVLTAIRQFKETADRKRSEPEPFRDALRERTPLLIVTPALAALSGIVFLFMLFGAGALSDPESLVGWGGNYAPRTTNGEWSRLVTSMFVHPGLFPLLVNLAGLVSVGLILERLVGPFAFAAVYFAAGVLASLVSLSIYPMAVSVGASGAVFGVYGLLLASSVWGIVHRSPVTLPVKALKTLGPLAAVFVLYNMATDSLHGEAEITGLIVGVFSGLALTRSASERTPPVREVAAVVAATLMTVVAIAIPLRGLTDARPEIQRVVAVEDRTAAVYDKAVEQFRLGAMNADALAGVINKTILPDVQAERARLKALGKVPPEHKPLVAAADEYLRLRDESWRLRVDALHKSNMIALRKADSSERTSLDAFERIRPTDK